MSSGRKASEEEIVWDDLVLSVKTIICPDRVGIEQENLFTKPTATAKQFKLSSWFLGNRDSLQDDCTEVQYMDRTFCLKKKKIELLSWFDTLSLYTKCAF